MPGLPSGGGAGGALGLGPEQNTFGDGTTADRAAAEALRDAYEAAQAAWLALYDVNRSFFIRLQWMDGTVEQRRNAAGDAWEDASFVFRGLRGPGPTAAEVTAAVAAGVKSYARIGSSDQIPDGDIPAAITRDSEITSAAIVSLISGDIAFTDIDGMVADGQVPASFMRDAELTLASTAAALGLTVQEVAQLLVGAPTLNGRDLTFALNDGSTVTRELPAAGGTADGRLRFGVGDPAADLGDDGDTYVNLSTGEAWEKVAGNWTEHGTFTFARLQQMSRTRYATHVADNANPLEAEWLAGNTSLTDHIVQPAREAGEYDAYAIPAWQASLTVMQQASGVFNERGLFSPGTDDEDVTQMISGVNCKTYIATSPGGARASEQTWILRPAPP